ncbi:MAG TPA: 50S ribosomal protein L1 [candidate division Zixibacteria bacterium]|nr:50S ribosomal protein L1 [candidate division Zixibacteria bacterium]HBZ00415.1 50S ribosomal protein L1 [candidate division Zixibacteria bacterium]
MKRGKNYKQAASKLEQGKTYTLGDAVKLLRQMPRAKFDETLEAAVRLGVDPKKADQMVRGTTVLPHGTGKTIKVLVLTKGEKAKEAQDAGADMVGAEDYVEKIQGGWADVDVIIATPDMMGQVGKLGKILGPKKLMPNPKSGTVTMDIAKAIKAVKAGKIEYRVDKTGNVQAGLGKVSFSDEALVENAKTFFSAIMKAKPSTAKGTYLRSATLCTTMSPGIKLDINEITALGK